MGNCGEPCYNQQLPSLEPQGSMILKKEEKKRVQNYRVKRIHRYPKTPNNSQPPERKKGKNRVGPHVMTERHEPTFLISKNLLSEELDKVKKPNKIGFPFPSKDKNNRS